MDLRTSHARTPSQIALEKATQSVQYKINTVEWSIALTTNTQNEWYHKNQDEAATAQQASGLTTAEPLGFDFTAKSAATTADTLIPYDCTIKNCQVMGVQQGASPGDRDCEIFIGYVTYTPGVNVTSTNSLMQSIGTEAVTFEDGWKITTKDLTTFNDKKISKNSMLYIMIRTTSSGPTNNCSVKIRFDVERKLCSCA